MSQDFRLDNVGMVNREKKISFKFNGKKYFGFEGDTIASALIAVSYTHLTLPTSG